MDATKLAVLINQLGGYDEAESLINVDADTLYKAVSGERLTRQETAQVETGYNQLILDTELADEAGIDLTEIDETSENLDRAKSFFYDAELASKLNEAVGNGDIDLDLINSGGGNMFANFPPKMLNRISTLLDENKGDKVNELFQGYINDYRAGVPFWRQDQLKADSEFWEIWRELFYNE